VTGDRKKRIPSRFLYEVLRTAVSLLAAPFAYLMRGRSNKTAVSTQLLVTCHLSPVTFKYITLPIFLLCFLTAVSCNSSRSRSTGDSAVNPGSATPLRQNPDPGFPSSESAVQTNDAAALKSEIDRIINESNVSGARWGIYVMMPDGQLLYTREGNSTFIPASNMKLFTTAIALDLLGPDYRWRTSVFAAENPDSSGTINGDLTLFGRGAPDLNAAGVAGNQAHLSVLANALFIRGVRRVNGDIIGDESYFRAERYGDGWLWNDLQWYYGATPSALSVNGNEIGVEIGPGATHGAPATVKLSYDSGLITIKNDALTAQRSDAMTVGVERGLSGNDIHIWGNYPLAGNSVTARIAVSDPALLAATLFRDALRARGIVVSGSVNRRDFRTAGNSQTVGVKSQVELASVESRSLAEIIKETNKDSINLNAELIFRTVGKERGYTAPDPNPRKMSGRGDDEAAQAVEKKWLRDKGIDTELLSIRDGCGLSRLDIVTPEATARLLLAMSTSKWGKLFLESLPEGARDGTLKGRLTTLGEHRVFAKTGTLTYVNSLSGFALTRNNRQLIFSIYCNDGTAATTATPVIDSVVRALVQYPG
jgi:D-alanyl-D-alanine carboxypeptidase/D-alanyl-D-alanine-endopeptidase (penicillin-binding protein 4)